MIGKLIGKLHAIDTANFTEFHSGNFRCERFFHKQPLKSVGKIKQENTLKSEKRTPLRCQVLSLTGCRFFGGLKLRKSSQWNFDWKVLLSTCFKIRTKAGLGRVFPSSSSSKVYYFPLQSFPLPSATQILTANRCELCELSDSVRVLPRRCPAREAADERSEWTARFADFFPKFFLNLYGSVAIPAPKKLNKHMWTANKTCEIISHFTRRNPVPIDEMLMKKFYELAVRC